MEDKEGVHDQARARLRKAVVKSIEMMHVNTMSRPGIPNGKNLSEWADRPPLFKALEAGMLAQEFDLTVFSPEFLKEVDRAVKEVRGENSNYVAAIALDPLLEKPIIMLVNGPHDPYRPQERS